MGLFNFFKANFTAQEVKKEEDVTPVNEYEDSHSHSSTINQPESSVIISPEQISELYNSITQPSPILEASNSLVNNEKNPITAPETFSIKQFFNQSSYEREAYQYLKEALTEEYSIFPHVSLRDLFESDIIKYEHPEYNKYKFFTYHVDFAIFDRAFHPVLAIEINGAGHKSEFKEYRTWNDTKKKELFDIVDLPLLIIKIPDGSSKDAMKIKINHKLESLLLLACCWDGHCILTCNEDNTFVSSMGTLFVKCGNRKNENTCIKCKKRQDCAKKHLPVKPIFKMDEYKIENLLYYHMVE